MNQDELLALSDHLKCVGTKAVNLDRYLQRRAWGIYYSIWAFSIFLFTFLSYPFSLITSVDIQVAAYAISYVLIVIFAGYLSGLVFSKASRLARLQNVLSDKSQDKTDGGKVISYLIFFAIIVALVVIGTDLLRSLGGVILEASFLAIVDIYVYRMIRKSLGAIPLEGIAAISTFMFSNIGSAFSDIILKSPFYYGYFWIPTIIVWFIASVYAIYHSPDELQDKTDFQECS
jgi:nitrogen fixation protein FixH